MVKDMYQHQRTFIDTSQMPTMARAVDWMIFLEPDGRRTRVLPVSVLCEMIEA